jgi:oxygen-independent coproporphyrinogen-3 oxidase
VGDEVAALHAQGVRALLVEDDLFLLPDERRSLARLSALQTALAERGIGRLAIWAKARPESVTPAVARAARELGIVHLFLGIESASPERLAYLGRTHSPAQSERALELCRAHDIQPSFNLMLFDPDVTLEQITPGWGVL